jgi:hypothetical protein
VPFTDEPTLEGLVGLNEPAAYGHESESESRRRSEPFFDARGALTSPALQLPHASAIATSKSVGAHAAKSC